MPFPARPPRGASWSSRLRHPGVLVGRVRTRDSAVMNDTAYDFTGLRALFINCTLKRSPEPSNTQGLVDASRAIMERHGVHVDVVRAIDHDIATGVWPDMRE